MNIDKLQPSVGICLLLPLTVCTPQRTGYMETQAGKRYLIVTTGHTAITENVCKLSAEESCPACEDLKDQPTEKKRKMFFDVEVNYLYFQLAHTQKKKTERKIWLRFFNPRYTSLVQILKEGETTSINALEML